MQPTGAMAEQDTELAETPGLVRALRVLRERWPVILLCGLVAAVVAFVYVEHKHNVYTATASLQFTTNSLPDEVAGVGGGASLDPEGEKNTNVQLVTATPVAEAVIKQLRLKQSPAELLNQVTASDPQNDYVVDVAATDGDPKAAAGIANAFATQYVNYSQEQNQQQLIKGQQLIEQREAQLPTGDTVDRANLAALSQKLLLLQSVASANARVANTAETPGSPSSPNRKATVLVALIFGLIAGIALAFLLNMLNNRVNAWEEFAALYGLPELAAIPELPRSRSSRERESELEPFRILNNSLALLAPDHVVKTVLVTSAVPGEGKTTVAVGLARAAALSGSRVVLVEADLRRPSIGSRLQVDPRADGLASVLFDGADPSDLLQEPVAGMPRLRVLPAGPVPEDAANRLRPDALGRALASLSLHADLIVIDAAPLLPVVDTRLLLDELDLDAHLIVARVGLTKRHEIRSVRALIEQRRLEHVGLVINALSSSIARDYYGGAYYGGDALVGSEHGTHVAEVGG
jgi:succinoglycan biosynthesis transport protein ExoP